MTKFMLSLLFFVPMLVQSQSMPALYRVVKVQHVYKLVKPKCVEVKKTKKNEAVTCDKTLHWRVYYRAVSPHVTLQKHQVLLDDEPPQINAVTQLTIDL